MTREEAIEILEEMIKLGDLYEVDINACEVAIEALKQEPCDDAISRQAVIGSIFDDDTEYTGSEVCSMVRNLPSVNPQEPKTDEENIHREREQAYMQGYEDACKKYRQEPKTGHWIIHGEPPINVIECSECGQKYHNHYCQPLAHFCSMCGYRMVEPQESEEQE